MSDTSSDTASIIFGRSLTSFGAKPALLMVVDFEGAKAGVLISACRTQHQNHVTLKLETLAAQAYIGSGSGEGDQMSEN